MQLQQLLDDVKFQISHKSYVLDEIAVMFHHRLVFIHPFSNGNGRLSRIITDAFLSANNCEIFTWGMINKNDIKTLRKKYISALRAADDHNYLPLLEFVKS